MQTVIQVIASGRGSLREKIMTDPQLGRFNLIPTEHQRPGRPHGWRKIHSGTAHGAINLEWHGRSRTLICRVVTKLGNNRTPSLATLSITCLPAIKAAFCPFTSCGGELDVSPHEFDSLGEDFEKKEDELFGEDGFEKVVEKRLGVYDLAQFTLQRREINPEPTGLEPATSAVTGRRSNQLS